jgi:hypothetical protein
MDEPTFWQKYTCDGKHMTWSRVLEVIKEKRMDNSTEIAECARKVYGDRFTELFRYKCPRTRTWTIMTSSHAIAHRYQKLKEAGL